MLNTAANDAPSGKLGPSLSKVETTVNDGPSIIACEAGLRMGSQSVGKHLLISSGHFGP